MMGDALNFSVQYSVVCCVGLLMVGCQLTDTQEAETIPDNVSPNPTSVVHQFSLEDCSEFGCPNGCEQIDYGVDDNANGTLDSDEVDGTAYVCHGTNLSLIHI